jgi:porphobilinogen synthase
VSPVERPRRLRATAAIRNLVAETQVRADQLILPVFVKEVLAEPRPIQGMPGVFQHSLETIDGLIQEALAAGIGGVMVFGIPTKRDSTGSEALNPNGILNRAVRQIRAQAGERLVVVADLCLDEFTDHGHCGVLAADGSVDNDATLEIYAKMAVALAEAGAQMLGASGMMDGQVGATRAALDAAGHIDVSILAYAAKYASAFYGPFRDAVDSQLHVEQAHSVHKHSDRKTYQQDPRNAREAMREVRLDVAEGADIVMVKPALAYLDIVASTRNAVDVPVAAYIVSGEMAMLEAAAAKGLIQREAAMLEVLASVKRAGADIVCTYWAIEAAGLLSGGKNGGR